MGKSPTIAGWHPQALSHRQVHPSCSSANSVLPPFVGPVAAFVVVQQKHQGANKEVMGYDCGTAAHVSSSQAVMVRAAKMKMCCCPSISVIFAMQFGLVRNYFHQLLIYPHW